MGFDDLIPAHVRDRIDEARVEAERNPPPPDDPPGTVRCAFCRDVIPSLRNAYRRVEGWERDRSAQGGTNHVVLRQTHDEWACTVCIAKLRGGVAIGQESLLA